VLILWAYLKLLYRFAIQFNGMKKIIIILIASVSLVGCKKEFTCNNGEVIKKGDPRYEILVNNGEISDINGTILHCY